MRPPGVWDRSRRSVGGGVLGALVEENLLAIGRYGTSYTPIGVCYQLCESRACCSASSGSALTPNLRVELRVWGVSGVRVAPLTARSCRPRACIPTAITIVLDHNIFAVAVVDVHVV